MKLKLLLLGDLATKAGRKELTLELEENGPLTLDNLLSNLSNLLKIEEEAWNIESSYMVMVNGISIPAEKWKELKLKDEDLVVIAPLYIGGG